jgi:preprotein translocase subunit SecE
MKNPGEIAKQGREFFSEVQLEWKKITWPTQKETVGGTIGVIVLVTVISVGLFAVDAVISWLMRSVFSS